MRVAKFKVERYRSIQTSESIDLTTLSVLVGPNNEGKSNILRAIVVGLRALARIGQEPSRARLASGSLRRRIDEFQIYDWTRDFPLTLQAQTPGASSVFEYEFELNDSDLADFKQRTGHALNGHLKIRVLLDRHGGATFKVVKRGRGSTGMNANIRKISEFVSRRIQVEYIPASRTADESLSIVRREVMNTYRRLADTAEFASAIKEVERLAQAALVPVQKKLLENVQSLVPSVRGIDIAADWGPGYLSPDRIDVHLDDGLKTSLSTKGDGIQSLVAIAWLRMTATERTSATCILAVEEPEAHLHPGAIHELALALDELAAEHQVILTTHSPILVRREPAHANIIVRAHSAAPARSLTAVRDCLGVRLPDNMTSAEVMLIVEGTHDAAILRHLLQRMSPALSTSLKNGRLGVRDAGGAQNVPYHFKLTSDAICRVHAVLDDDKEGRSARAKLEAMGVQPSAVTMLTGVGMNESELEDLFDDLVFSAHLSDRFNVSCDPSVTQPAKRFSLRMKDYFDSSGQSWSDSVASNLKSELAHMIVDDSRQIFVREDRMPVLRMLVNALERKLQVASFTVQP